MKISNYFNELMNRMLKRGLENCNAKDSQIEYVIVCNEVFDCNDVDWLELSWSEFQEITKSIVIKAASEDELKGKFEKIFSIMGPLRLKFEDYSVTVRLADICDE